MTDLKTDIVIIIPGRLSHFGSYITDRTFYHMIGMICHIQLMIIPGRQLVEAFDLSLITLIISYWKTADMPTCTYYYLLGVCSMIGLLLEQS